jgi:hypothetical protein
MIQGNDTNRGAATISDVTSELSLIPDAQGAVSVAADPATRGKQRTKQQFQQNRFVIIGAGALVVALLLFVAVSVPHRKASKATKGTTLTGPGTIQQNEASSTVRSLLPITDSGKPLAKETHEGLLGEEDLRRSAITKPTPARPLSSPQADPITTLASIPPFPEQWQAPPYQPAADNAAAAPDLSKAEHQALETASMVYARDAHPTQSNSPSQNQFTSREPVIELGLVTGTRLRARLESAVSTALRMPVLAVIEYNYERAGEIIVPAGAKALGHVQQADRSGYMTIQFDSLLMPDGTATPIQAVATDLSLRPPKGRVEGKNTGKSVLLRSLSGVGQMGALLVGHGSLNQPLSESDMLRERMSNNIGEASDEQVARLAFTERVVVTIPADTPIYVILGQTAKSSTTVASSVSSDRRSSNEAGLDELRQLLQLQHELQPPKTDQ